MYLNRKNHRHHPGFASILDDLFNGNAQYPVFRTNGHVPATNIRESDEGFALELVAPGRKRDDFKIKLDKNLLTISYEQESKTEEKDDNGKYSRKEFSYSSFSRSFRLPDTVNFDGIEAKYEDGILHLMIPKNEEAKVDEKRVITVS